ncbi:hypothetical protein HNP84_001576 [Thermocatellispora tengchongensis]|uniref:DUF4132 domain-containing protein n=1 Tax=Thermocatellispora tengchongensis TaxID=1073253 RepID=A0A840P1Q6_9ACTN|nr:DUF4132 domain-containing protein [Thermocatellispora tengchongensis]MBB5131863.1 hypothetical protein [Thermocatellispora tengchongensis]
MPATPEHELALDGATLVCRNGTGRRLPAVPKAARRSPAAEALLALRDYMERHERECRATVESWLLTAFPVPVVLIGQVWPDPAWRAALEHLVVVPGEEPPGMLRGVDARGRIVLLGPSGEERVSPAGLARIVHPLRLGELDSFRALAARLGVTQAVAQLARETHARPAGARAGTGVTGYADARFAELRHATDRAARLGFGVRGGYAVCRVVEEGVPIQARYWLGAGAPEAETWTGELLWVGADETPIPIADVGAVAWSEGVRMAELIYAGRLADED